MRAINIYTVIKTIIREKQWYWIYLGKTNGGEGILTFADFTEIMIWNEITSYDRKIKELYATMVKIGIAKKSNSVSIIFNFDKINEMMTKYGKITDEDLTWARGILSNSTTDDVQV